MNRAYISFGALWGEPISPLRLKVATLLFDEVVFQREQTEGFADKILYVYDNGAPVSKDSRRALEECWSGVTDATPRFSIYGVNDEWPWDNASKSLCDATKSVMQELWGAKNVSEDENYELYKAGGYLMSDILHWRAYFGDATLVSDRAAESVVERLNLFPYEGKSGYTSIAADLPNILEVPWEGVVELRRSSFLQNFRRKYSELTREDKIEQLFDEYLETLERLADAVRPNTAAEVTKAVLGNLPTPIINPISIGSSVRDIWRSERLKREYGWVFFLRELRGHGEQSPLGT